MSYLNFEYSCVIIMTRVFLSFSSTIVIMKEQNVKDTQRKNDEMNFLENFLVSGAAAVISKTVAAPIERVKLLVQNQDELLKVGFLDRPYNGVIDCTMRTYRSEGIIPFWRGNLANCIRYLPTQGLNFAFKDKIKEAFHPGPSDPYLMSLGKNIASGGVAGGLSLCFVYSLDYARTRLGNDVTNAKGGKRQFNGLIDVYVKTMKSDGIVGLYRGFVISCVGIVVYRGAYFGLYDTLKPIMLGKITKMYKEAFCQFELSKRF